MIKELVICKNMHFSHRRAKTFNFSDFFLALFKNSVSLQPQLMPNGVIGNTTDSGSVKSRFEPWLGNKII